MSANPSDPATERLNYFNGQRLAAGDLRTEQSHHVGMRRVLNRSLYSPGIVTGLEVVPDKTHKHRVIVRRGLAFDHLGREIFVAADQAVLVMGVPSTVPGVVFGNLLTVSYQEARSHPVNDRCAVNSPAGPCSGDLPWGAPTRILADARFDTLDAWPAEDSGRVVLAQIELDAKCEVKRVLPGVRKYAVPVKPQTVQALSLEGEKDIDAANPKVLVFHIAGGAPESATLYLRGRRLSTLYYTEMGTHKHVATIDIDKTVQDLTHSHDIADSTTDKAGEHSHRIRVDVNDGDVDEDQGRLGVDSEDWNECDFRFDTIEATDGHTHKLTNLKVNSNALKPEHKHIGTATVMNSGVTDLAARTGNVKALTQIDDLKLVLDGVDVTARVRQQLEARPGQAGQWPKLGDGTDTHPFASADGTGEIDLLKLGVELGLGSHKLEMRASGAGNGGAVQYNLYVS